jgi:hypothetical protein
MNAMILLSLVIASAMAAPAPQVLQSGLTLQSAGGIPTTFLTSSPQLFTTQQFVQQPAFLAAQTAIQQEEALEAQEQQQEVQQQQQEAAALVRDPSNPTTDIFLHSGFPLVSGLSGAQGSLQSPFTLTSSPFTRVGISSAGVQQQAQLVQAPQAQSAQLVAAAPQAQSAQLVAQPQVQSAQLVQAPQQSTQFFTTTGQQFQTQQVAAAPQQQQTFTFQPLQTASLQQLQQPQQQQQQQQVAVQQQAAASPAQFSSGPLIFSTSQQQPSTLTGFRTVATPFTFQTVPAQ